MTWLTDFIGNAFGPIFVAVGALSGILVIIAIIVYFITKKK